MIAVSVARPHDLRVVEAEIPAVASGEVLVRVVRAGICGSDMHIFHGSNPFARYPRIIGHEFAGEIAEVGPNVTGFKAGDRVVVDPVVACGHCYPCRIGRSNVCAHLEVMGVHRDGGFRNFIAVPAGNAVKLKAETPIGIGALAEPFSIAANILERTGCGPDDTVLLYGAGTVGVTVMQVAKMNGARVIVADPDRARLERALGFGADKVLVSGVDDIPARVAPETDGLGPTLVIDCAGVPALLEEACRVASPAGRVGVMGFSPAPCNISQQEIVKKELTLYGSRLNRRLIPKVVEWLEGGKLKPEAMITQTFAAKDAAAAFELFEKEPGKTIKIQLDFAQ
ncbi:Zn-dependent oxidoreductase [Ancylobacter sonchi]|uniref:Zn-dependent oxidoreductase n=1 Tax=Ancylobacter sonchi TaxID=1937790 RepID=UPI001BD3D292|nr:Zn-dependent oxidoreductase [Ancylobacter sonchi]MBS7533346.1 Zn-dependent oxidoreductase [Ancylobacter sonchi]